MKKSAIAFFGLLALSLTAAAQPPAWFLIKHPEAAAMERMQAKKTLAAKESRMKTRLASHENSSGHATSHSHGS